jgi:hypothetical protein
MRRKQFEIRLHPLRHDKAKQACCPRCGAGPGMVCVSLNQHNVRPHVERIVVYENQVDDLPIGSAG